VFVSLAIASSGTELLAVVVEDEGAASGGVPLTLNDGSSAGDSRRVAAGGGVANTDAADDRAIDETFLTDLEATEVCGMFHLLLMYIS
jgi:hypothetical protein